MIMSWHDPLYYLLSIGKLMYHIGEWKYSHMSMQLKGADLCYNLSVSLISKWILVEK